MEKPSERSFTLSDGSVYYVVNPNTEDIKNADWAYSKIYTKSLMEGIVTSSEMVDILTKRGLIGPEYEQRAQELSDNLREAIESLRKAKDNTEKTERAEIVASAREELFRWNQRFSNPMSHTCEQLADDTRLENLAFSMIRDENNKRVWNKYEEYIEDKNQELMQKARLEVMLYLQGVSSDFMNLTPEAVAMREVSDDLFAKMTEDELLEEIKAEEAEEADEEVAAEIEANQKELPEIEDIKTKKVKTNKVPKKSSKK